MCASDFNASIVISKLKRRGISIPGDMLIAGFDDAPMTEVLIPELTTIHIHSDIMGQEAVRLLMSRISNPSLRARTVYTETSLCIRNSTKRTGKNINSHNMTG